jgi:hypothetical protein
MNIPRSVRERARDIEVIGSYDVVVCGGGPSGIMAAIAAAREGAQTLLIERYGFLGGMATAGLVGPISKFNLNGRRIVGGIPLEFIERMAQKGGAIIDLPSGNVPFDSEVYKSTADEMIQETGVSLLLHSLVVGCVESETGRVSHVIAETPSGRAAAGCGAVIDCTGTGRLIESTSLALKHRGSASDDLQPMSLIFRLGGVDTGALTVLMSEDGTKYRNATLAGYLQTAVHDGRLSNYGGPWTVWGSVMRDGCVSVNATRFQGDATIAGTLTDAETRLRKDIEAIVDCFKENAPAFADCYIADVAPQVGIRETRSIDGIYTLTGIDLIEPKAFPDAAALGGHPVDIHHPDNPEQTVSFIEKPYAIPYRSIVPKSSSNVLASGGIMSATKEAFASARVQAQCMALGQAAGTAAAICRKERSDVAELDADRLRKTLERRGAITQTEGMYE